MKALSPGIRDTATDGMSALARRPDWCATRSATGIRARIQDALDDENPVVRMYAAQAVSSLHADLGTAERVRIVGDRLKNELHPDVQNVLLTALASEAGEAPQEVDDALREFIEKPAKGTDDGKDDDNLCDLAVEILTSLAVTRQAPFALRSIERWVASAPRFSAQSQRIVPSLRQFITPQKESDLQARAFQFLATAADAAVDRWTRNPEEHRGAIHLSEVQKTELQSAFYITESVAEQIYFASGASDRGEAAAAPSASRHEQFASRSFPMLATCARSGVATIIHRIVETLVYLAPLDEKRALLAIADAVATNYNYTADPLAGGLVIPYLKRVLAEQRQLVLFDEHGVVAFRRVLSAFASTGNELALEIAFTFADIFR